MSFLNQLKSQASALQTQDSSQQQNLQANLTRTEAASQTTWLYFTELAKQLNIIAPAGPVLTLDGKTRWPAMKLLDFRSDALQFDYLTQSRGSVMVTPQHDKGTLGFRLANVSGFGIVTTSYPAAQIQTPVLDELAKLLVGQPSRFV